MLDDAAWSRFARLLAEDGETWALDPALAEVAGRRAAQASVDQRVAGWSRVRHAAELERRLQAAGVAAGLVANAADLMHDPQLAHRGYFETLAVPEGGHETFDGIPFVSTALPGRVSAPGPLLGEHGDLVLHDLLGLSSDEIAALRAEGVIA